MQYTETAEALREAGKYYLFNSFGDEEKKNEGVSLILAAFRKGDPEASFIVARLLLDGVLVSTKGTAEEAALDLMREIAGNGYTQARAFLNGYCRERYDNAFKNVKNVHANKDTLVDFDGEPIKVDRKGLLTPIDVVLTNENGKNILTISANIYFQLDEDFENLEEYRKAVLEGIMLWQGEYKVFGGQNLEVRVNLTTEQRLVDSVFVLAANNDIFEYFKEAADFFGDSKNGGKIKNTLLARRSFASAGFKWSTKSRKLICIQSEDGMFNDYEEIKHVAKHEFGHALGLGDLYYSPSDSLAGVDVGTYKELDSYAITKKLYNLVMCDHHGPISNNDIEMVVLAFSENKMQLFQPQLFYKKISEALGQGN